MTFQMDFSAYILLGACITGVILLGWRSHDTVITRFARSTFPIFLLMGIFRAFIGEPFRIPSGSMDPVLRDGDFIFVNKLAYAIKLPVIGTVLWQRAHPQVGDVVVFRFPLDLSQDVIKRVIGLPGDRVAYRDNQLYRNGIPVPVEELRETYDVDDARSVWVKEGMEQLPGRAHRIFRRLPGDPRIQDFPETTVPADQYFVMGDNRNNSSDSRVWGFLPQSLILGRAVCVIFSVDPLTKMLRWERTGWIAA